MLRESGILLALATAAVFAQAGDPPGRVARLNYENGPVSFRPGSVDDWSAAVPNYPLTTGDHLWTDQGATAEFHAGSTAIRMREQTALSFLNLDDRTVQLSLTQGMVDVRIRDLRPDEVFEVDTPNGAISLLRAGEYRINTDGDSAVTEIAVRGGEAEVTAGGTAFPVHPLQAAQISGPDGRGYNLVGLAPPDPFERWCEDRDRFEEQAQSVRYVPRGMVGYEDLDRYGGWRNVPPYGWVWAPNTVAAGWVPYRYGHWVWVAPWGWTWVDDAPWGFAPFHYGRWAYAGGVWVWVPGRIVERPVYAPALVAFVGGAGFSLSVFAGGGGGVAWFPLGPGEVFRPAYHVSEVYVQNVNITHVTVTNINVVNVRYVNQTVPGAVIAAPREAFVTARPIGQVSALVSARELERAQVVGTTPAIAPRPESIVIRSTTTVAIARPPARLIERTVAVKNTPPPPPVSFRAQQAALQANQGRPLDANTLGNLRNTAGAAVNAPRFRAAAPVNTGTAPAAPQFRNDRPPNATFAPRPGVAQESAPVRRDVPGSIDRPGAVSSAPVRNEAAPLRNDRPAPATSQPAATTPRNDRPSQTQERKIERKDQKKEQKKEERREER
jgi:hypothetical protein